MKPSRDTASANGVGQPPAAPLRILVVEDEAVIAVLMAEVLEAMGHGVCSIENSEAGAVMAAERCRPDLMIVDVGLRTGCGVSAVVQILRRRFVPHVFVTGGRLSAEELDPAAVVLHKPFDEHSLALAMQHALDGASRRLIGPE